MGGKDQSFFYPKGWDPALIRQVERTGAYRRPDRVKVPVYNRYFTDEEFRRCLTEVTTFINERLRENGYAFALHEAEVATNLLSEGADVAIASGFSPYTIVDAFGNLGIDTFMEQYRQLKRWLPQRLIRVVEAGSIADLSAVWSEGRFALSEEWDAFWSERMVGRRPYTARDRGSGLLTRSNINEKGEQYYTLDFIDLELGMYANAAMLAQAMATASKDIPTFGELDPEDRFFWATMYFNSGPGTARKFLKRHGVSYSDRPYSGGKNKWLSSQYHAIKRMASMGYLLRTVYAGQ